METGDIAPETREMSKVRESKGQEEKRDARMRNEGENQKDVTLKRSFAARQAAQLCVLRFCQ